MLKEQRALFLLMVAYATTIVAALFKWQEIAQKWAAAFPGTPVMWLFVVAFAPVFVPVAVVIHRRWRTAGLERRVRDISEHRLNFHLGHFRTGPYGGTKEDRKAYARTDLAHETALTRLRSAAGKGEPFFFLHSQSGCGKTSLLQAFVMPALEEAGWRIIALRGYTGVLPELAKALGLPGPATLNEIREALAAEAAARHAAGGTLLVAVDQFEEFFIRHPAESERWEAVREWLAALRAAPVPGLLVLLSLRSEYQPDTLKLGLPDFDSARSYTVPLFTVEDARKFLRNGLEADCKKAGTLPLDEFIRQMEDRDDVRGKVRPVQANLVGHAYRTYAADFHRRLLANKRVDFLADWLQRLLERRELRLHARPIFEALLQKDGSRCPARVDDIATETTLDPDVVRYCLSAFESEGLVRCLTPDLTDDHQKLWEISHDFLAVQIMRLLSFWRRLWHESINRAIPPMVIGIWLASVVLFNLNNTKSVENALRVELQKGGVHWNERHRKASVAYENREHFNSEDLKAAIPLLKALRCTELDLSNCTNLDDITSLRDLSGLKTLELYFCYGIKNVDGLEVLSSSLEYVAARGISVEVIRKIRKQLPNIPVVNDEKD